MLAFVPAIFELYRPLGPHLRWTLQSLVAFADCTGRCFPSVRKLAAFAGLSKSAVSRHLRDLVEAGVITRRRRPGSVYEYEIDPRFLPRAPVSHWRPASVPQQAGQETEPPKQTREARKRARLAKPGMMEGGGLPDPADQWTVRLRSWQRSRFWLSQHWGPAPDQPGCYAPLAVLHAALRAAGERSVMQRECSA